MSHRFPCTERDLPPFCTRLAAAIDAARTLRWELRDLPSRIALQLAQRAQRADLDRARGSLERIEGENRYLRSQLEDADAQAAAARHLAASWRRVALSRLAELEALRRR